MTSWNWIEIVGGALSLIAAVISLVAAVMARGAVRTAETFVARISGSDFSDDSQHGIVNSALKGSEVNVTLKK